VILWVFALYFDMNN